MAEPPHNGYEPTTDEELDEILGPADVGASEAPPPEPVGIWADELLRNPDLLRPPEAVVDRFAWAGRFTLFSAREKAGKSTLLTLAASAVTTGQSFFVGDEPREPGYVLWVGLEEAPGDILRRLVHYKGDPARVYLVTHLASMDQLAEAAQEPPGFDLCIVDTLAALGHAAGLVESENDATQMTAACAPLVALAHAPGAAAWVVSHHANRAEKGGYRGSTAIGAAADVLIDMEEIDTVTRKFKTRARWHMLPFRAALDHGRYRLVHLGDDTAAQDPSLDLAIQVFLEAHPGTSRDALAAELGGRKSVLLGRVDNLIIGGVIHNRGVPGRSALYLATDRRSRVVPESGNGAKDMGERELARVVPESFPASGTIPLTRDVASSSKATTTNLRPAGGLRPPSSNGIEPQAFDLGPARARPVPEADHRPWSQA